MFDALSGKLQQVFEICAGWGKSATQRGGLAEEVRMALLERM